MLWKVGDKPKNCYCQDCDVNSVETSARHAGETAVVRAKLEARTVVEDESRSGRLS